MKGDAMGECGKLEIERRYLLPPCKVRRWLDRQRIPYRALPIEQFYFTTDEKGIERYRSQGDRYLHTCKRGEGLVREEEERSIDEATYLAAKARHGGNVIRKIRYVFQWRGRTYELDVFKKALKGLVILEVEFPDVTAARDFSLPKPLADIVLAEVTERSDFSNAALSKRVSLPTIEEPLETLRARVVTRREGRFLKASTPLDYAPYEKTGRVLKLLFFTLTETVVANRNAMLAGDTDPERLHQFRVAMRKMRAILSRFEGSFDSDWLTERKSRLKQLMRRSGTMRDIDVYLGQIERYKTLVGSKHVEGIERFRQHLQQMAEKERRSLLVWMEDPLLLSELETLRRFALRDDESGLDGDKSKKPYLPAVKSNLRKLHAKVLRDGERLKKDTPAEAYHRVRIEVKKLRYLLEFSAPALESESLQTLLVKLKRIQTILGDHQDLDVQRNHLQHFLESSGIDDRKTVAAIEALRKKMKVLEAQKREEFAEAYREFADTRPLLKRAICRF
jgi:CHAD domain-containing protein/CYTH domain-containing protein